MLLPEKPPNVLESLSVPLDDGIKKEKSNQSELQEDKEDSALKSTKRQKSPLCCMQESLPNLKKTTYRDKLSFYNQNTQMGNCLKRLEADSILNGENCSLYWNEYTKAISQCLSSPIVTDSSDSDFLLLSGYANKVNANSWFDRERKLSPEQELVEDLLAILHCFSSRLYGLRKYRTQVKKEIQEKTSPPDKEVNTKQCQENQGISL